MWKASKPCKTPATSCAGLSGLRGRERALKPHGLSSVRLSTRTFTRLLACRLRLPHLDALPGMHGGMGQPSAASPATVLSGSWGTYGGHLSLQPLWRHTPPSSTSVPYPRLARGTKPLTHATCGGGQRRQTPRRSRAAQAEASRRTPADLCLTMRPHDANRRVCHIEGRQARLPTHGLVTNAHLRAEWQTVLWGNARSQEAKNSKGKSNEVEGAGVVIQQKCRRQWQPGGGCQGAVGPSVGRKLRWPATQKPGTYFMRCTRRRSRRYSKSPVVCRNMSPLRTRFSLKPTLRGTWRGWQMVRAGIVAQEQAHNTCRRARWCLRATGTALCPCMTGPPAHRTQAPQPAPPDQLIHQLALAHKAADGHPPLDLLLHAVDLLPAPRHNHAQGHTRK